MIFVHVPILKLSDATATASQSFASSLKALTGKQNASFTYNGRNALFLILKSMNLKKADEVILPAFTCRAVFNAVNAICTPVFADIDRETLLISPNEVKKKITAKTKAIVAVHSYGNACDLNSLVKICKDCNVKLIEDCAQSLLATYNGRPVGSFGDYSFFSFRFSKDITSFTGGAALSNNELINYSNASSKLAAFSKLALVKLASCAPDISRKTHSALIGRKESQEFKLVKKTLSSLQLSCLQFQFERLPAVIEIRTRNANAYKTLLKSEVQINTPPGSSFYRFPILVENREEVMQKLSQNGIESEIMYGYSLDESCKNAVWASKRILNLPVNQNLTTNDITRISIAVKNFLEQKKEVTSLE